MAKNQPMTPPAGDEIFLLKMGEMVLKGLNRRSFEDKLIGNLRRRTAKRIAGLETLAVILQKAF